MNPQQQFAQGALQQAAQQQYQLAKMAALANAYAGVKQKEEPKNEFLESVKKVYKRRVEMWIRFVMGIGGVVLFTLSPVLGGLLYQFWLWLGVVTEIAFGGAALVAGFLMVMSVIAVAMTLDRDSDSVIKGWARDWVEQK